MILAIPYPKMTFKLCFSISPKVISTTNVSLNLFLPFWPIGAYPKLPSFTPSLHIFPLPLSFWSSRFFPEVGAGEERLALACLTAAPAAWLPESPDNLLFFPRTLEFGVQQLPEFQMLSDIPLLRS